MEFLKKIKTLMEIFLGLVNSIGTLQMFKKNSNHKNVEKVLKGATKSYWKIIFAYFTKIGKNTTNILNCYFLS